MTQRHRPVDSRMDYGRWPLLYNPLPWKHSGLNIQKAKKKKNGWSIVANTLGTFWKKSKSKFLIHPMGNSKKPLTSNEKYNSQPLILVLAIRFGNLSPVEIQNVPTQSESAPFLRLPHPSCLRNRKQTWDASQAWTKCNGRAPAWKCFSGERTDNQRHRRRNRRWHDLVAWSIRVTRIPEKGKEQEHNTLRPQKCFKKPSNHMKATGDRLTSPNYGANHRISMTRYSEKKSRWSWMLNGPHLRYLRNENSRIFCVELTGISWKTWLIIVSF